MTDTADTGLEPDAPAPTPYDTLLALVMEGADFENIENIAKTAIADFRDWVERQMRQENVKDALLKLHEWDELIFGGFYCMHCTPADADDPDQNVMWPCPPLRDAGVTDEDAIRLITAHRAAVNAKIPPAAGEER